MIEAVGAQVQRFAPLPYVEAEVLVEALSLTIRNRQTGIEMYAQRVRASWRWNQASDLCHGFLQQSFSFFLVRRHPASRWRYASSAIGLRRMPRPSTSISQMSPGFMNSFGVRATPTPAGVPVTMTSPTSDRLAQQGDQRQLKIMSSVEAPAPRCRSAAFPGEDP